MEKNRWKWCVAVSFIIMLFGLLFMVTILERPMVQREQELRRDIARAFLEEYDAFEAKDISVDIQFRDADVLKKYDWIYARISAENDIVNMTCIYNVEYKLKNKKWVLQEFCQSDCNYTILNSNVTQMDANARIEAYYGERKNQDLRYTWKEHSLNLERGRESYTYSVEWQEGHKKRENCAVVWFAFDLKEGWQFSEVQCY